MPQLRSQRTRSTRHYEDSSPEAESGEETRCICGHAELQLPKKTEDSDDIDPGLFIQCDSCQVWQHGYCVGFYSEDEVPDVYYCEKCRPDLHLVVLRPSGKTSSYIPHLKELGQYNGSDGEEESAEAAANDDPGRESGRESEEGEGQGQGQGQGQEEGQEEEEQNDLSGLKHSDAEDDDRPRKELRSSRRDRGTSSASASRETSRSSKDPNSAAHYSHQRRRTQNSIRQYEYEETLKRVLEESVQDATVEDPNGVSGKRDSTISRRRRVSSEDVKNEDEEEDASSKSVYESRDANGSGRNLTLNGKLRAGSNGGGAGAGAGGGSGDSPTRLSRKRRSRGPGKDTDSQKSAEEDDRDEINGSQNASVGASRKKPRHKGKNHGQANSNGSSSSTASQSAAILTAKAKPRIPQARSTIPEMRKRVAAILEFIGRTQLDLAEEQEDRNKILEDRRDRYKEESINLQEAKFKEMFDFTALSSSLDSLTRKLLLWEQSYGRYGEETPEAQDEEAVEEDEREGQEAAEEFQESKEIKEAAAVNA